MNKALKASVVKLFVQTNNFELVKEQYKGQVYPDTLKRWCYPDVNERAKIASKEYHNKKKDDNEYKERRKKQSREYRKTEKYTETWQEHYKNTKEKRKKVTTEHRLKNIEKYKQNAKDNYFKNKDHYRHLSKEYYIKNKDQINRKELKRYHTDPITKLKHSLRVSLNRAVRYGIKKSNKALQYLGCSITDFKEYLEKKFKENMSWENRNLWHIDHIIPLSYLQNGYTLEQLCHYTNLQPIWKTDNLVKASSLVLDVKYDKDILQQEIDTIKNALGTYTSIPNHNKNVLHVQKHFYDKERILWTDDEMKERLIENRCLYLNKEPEQLTVNEILRGFKISGLYYGFSHFSPLWFKKFIQDYNVTTVYDPCGGWGHRLLGLLGTNINKYIYNDFDIRTYNGVKSIVERVELQKVVDLHNEDCSKFIPVQNVDAIFTCPPYYNKETYNNKRFKDKNDFMRWWEKTVQNCLHTKCRYFAYVIDEETSQMTEPVLSKYKLIQKTTLNTANHHFTEYKKNLEHLYVYDVTINTSLV